MDISRGIKLLEHLLKTMEKVVDQRLRKVIEINEMQYGFYKGRGTTDAIFVGNSCKKNTWRNRKSSFFFAFVDLEEAYDRIHREVVYWCLRKRGVPESTIRQVQATCTNTAIMVQIPQGPTECFNIHVGLHQGSALNPFLFIVVMDTITRDCRRGLPWELLYG